MSVFGHRENQLMLHAKWVYGYYLKNFVQWGSYYFYYLTSKRKGGLLLCYVWFFIDGYDGEMTISTPKITVEKKNFSLTDSGVYGGLFEGLRAD